MLQGSVTVARLAIHDARNEYTSRFKNTFNAIVSDPFLASTKKAENTMRQIDADHFCNSFLYPKKFAAIAFQKFKKLWKRDCKWTDKEWEQKKEVTQTAAGLIGKVQIKSMVSNSYWSSESRKIQADSAAPPGRKIQKTKAVPHT